MASLPLAFSIHNFISSVGADAGFAAIIGLAILVLLYFAHARETANLREEAALLTQRLMQAEARVAQLTRAQATSGPAPAPQATGSPQAEPVAAQAAGPAATFAADPVLPFAPAGVGAPALAAATRVVPISRAVAAQPVAATAAAAAHQAPRREPFEQEAPPPAVVPSAPRPEPFEHDLPVAAPVAATAAATVAGANGAGHGDDARGAPRATGTALPPLRTPPRSSGQATRGSLPPLPPLGEPPRSPSRLGRVVAVLVGVGLIAAVVAVLLIATTGGSTSSSSTPGAARTTNAPTTNKASGRRFVPASVTVTVLNATNVNQLAHRVAEHLTAGGYKEGNVLTAASQNATATVVSYLPGGANRNAALHVAAALRLKPSAVQPIDTSTRQVACQGATPCSANVVVTVGTDLATL